MSDGLIRILVVDDNRAMSRVIAFNLARVGYEVITAGNGREAWEQVQQIPFDLVITDQQMPEMEGMECCRRLRTLEQHRETPIIMLTAKALELDHQRLADELGVVAVLMKPFSPIDLVRFVQDCLAPVS